VADVTVTWPPLTERLYDSQHRYLCKLELLGLTAVHVNCQGALVFETHVWALSRDRKGRVVQRSAGTASFAGLPGTAAPVSFKRQHQARQVPSLGP